MNEFTLRSAAPSDADAIVRVSTGPVAGKQRFIAESLERRVVVAASVAATLAGYAIWDRAFFGRPFVWLLGVDPAYRRLGIASRLMRSFEANCAGESLFTSTNASNGAMQALLERIGFVRSGYIENIDPGDPELVYFKAGACSTRSARLRPAWIIDRTM